ncbi:uncharacterized protein [Scyliorhinus torazame]|uniref:uncharacterized protein isoform X2 n=1 Tax=Scyliorhinus torazame TaxID=75743 RepID=UPI003B5C2F40
MAAIRPRIHRGNGTTLFTERVARTAHVPGSDGKLHMCRENPASDLSAEVLTNGSSWRTGRTLSLKEKEVNPGRVQTLERLAQASRISEEEELQTEISNQTSRPDLTDSLNSRGLEYHQPLNREGKRCKRDQTPAEIEQS